MLGFRTDLAMECVSGPETELDGVDIDTQRRNGIVRTSIQIHNQKGAESLGRAVGDYITLECATLPDSDAVTREALIEMIEEAIRNMLPEKGEILVVGLGNRNVTADALGTRVVERMLVTRHLRQSVNDELKDRLRGVSAIAPGVLGLTGIETAELCKGIVRHVKPSAVVVIDALAAWNSERICTTVQITDTGIEPGSGVGNHRMGLTEETLGVRVVAVGVPMVVYASTIAHDAMVKLVGQYAGTDDVQQQTAQRMIRRATDGLLGDMVVTPREIDELVLSIADLLSDGLNRALQPAVDKTLLHTYLHR